MALSMRASQQSIAAALSARNPAAAAAATRRAAAAAAASAPKLATGAAGVAAITPRATAAAAGAAKAVVRQSHRLQFAAKSSVHSSFVAKFRPTGTGPRAHLPTPSSFLAPSSTHSSSSFSGRRLLPGSPLFSPCQGLSSTIQKNLPRSILPSPCSAREKILNKPKKSGLEVRVGAPVDLAGEGREQENDKVARPRKDARGGAPGSGSSARKSRRVEGLGVIGDQSAAQHRSRQQKSPPPPLPPPLGDRAASGQKSKIKNLRKTKRDGSAAAGNGSMRGAVNESMYEEADALLGLEDRQLAGGEEDLPGSQFMDAVVKVYCTHTEPNFSLPWQKRRQFQSTGSGFMVSGRRLLTNAHCVDHHTQVKVKRRGDDTKFVARVLAIGVECDIALLAVDDDAFWEGPVPLRFGSLPHLQDAVTVVGYPVGGDSISVTSGVVSRIEVTPYSHGSTELLGVQIDAAINAGNSGGPAFNESGECVGIAFQSLKTADTENIGYIIPTPVIFHFLGDYSRNGTYTGFPSIGISWQRMESPALRAALGMAAAQKGVFIRRVEPTSPAHSVLRPGDILLSFDGVPIANDGTVSFRTGERISFGFLVSQKFSGQDGQLEVLRDGQVMSVSVTLRPQKRLIPVHIEGKPPSYFIAAGLVFTPVCEPFLLSEYGQEYEYETPVSILQKLLHGQAQFEDEEVVVLSQVLANDCNIGYEDITNAIVKTVNGTPVRNLRQLASLVDSCSEQFLKIELEHAQLVVLEAAQVKAATAQVLLDHSIPQDRSDDLSKVEGAATLNGGGAVAAAAATTAVDAAGASARGKGVTAEAAGTDGVREDGDEVEDMMEEEEVTVLEVVGRASEQGGKGGKGGRKGREELPKKAEKRKVKGRR